MKNIFWLSLLFCSLFALTACGDDEDCCVPSGVVGTWVIEAEYTDPGDGSGDFVPIASGKTITLYEDGTYSTTNGTLCGGRDTDTESGTYTETELLPSDCSTIGGLPFTYELRDGKLFIHYPCIEACTERYVRQG